MKNVVENAKVVKLKKPIKPFRLANEPVDFQLGYHINNLVAYFHPANGALRVPQDQDVSAKTSDVLHVLDFLINNQDFIDLYLAMRSQAPLEFRCAQLISHYGPEKIIDWVNLIWGANRINIDQGNFHAGI